MPCMWCGLNTVLFLPSRCDLGLTADRNRILSAPTLSTDLLPLLLLLILFFFFFFPLILISISKLSSVALATSDRAVSAFYLLLFTQLPSSENSLGCSRNGTKPTQAGPTPLSPTPHSSLYPSFQQ